MNQENNLEGQEGKAADTQPEQTHQTNGTEQTHETDHTMERAGVPITSKYDKVVVEFTNEVVAGKVKRTSAKVTDILGRYSLTDEEAEKLNAYATDQTHHAQIYVPAGTAKIGQPINF